MIHTTMWTYPWDVIDEGVDRVIGFLKEEVGLDAISLSTVYHTYDQLRTHIPGKKLFSGYEDAIYFQPQSELYQGTKIKPHLHPMARDQDPVADHRRGLPYTRYGTDFVDRAPTQSLHGEAASRLRLARRVRGSLSGVVCARPIPKCGSTF